MMRVTKPSIGLAAALAGIYLLLAVFSVTCAIEHLEPQTSAHHHDGSLSHSSFCAWACQVNPTSDAGPVAVLLLPFLAATLVVERSHSVIAGGIVFRAASRAPPLQS